MNNRYAIALFALVTLIILGVIVAMNNDGSLLASINGTEQASETATKAPEATRQQPAAERPRAAAKAEKQAAAGNTGFDAARIEPDGTAVFAGRAEPGSVVDILANGQVIATTKADNSGEWAIITTHKLPAGDYQLSLSTKLGGSVASHSQTLRVAVAARPAAAATVASAASSSAVPVKPGAAPPARIGKAEQQQTAAAVTTRMMTNLEGLVASARTGAPPQPISVPLPITFVYGEAVMTPDGHTAAKLLSEFVKLRQLESLTLSGHADERGTADYNMELSRQRLRAIEQFLQQSGYTGKIVLVPKGKAEPYAGIDRKTLSREAAYQLDRRVELHLSR